MTLRVGTNYVRKLLTDAVAAGFTLECGYDGEIDYRGQDVDQAYEALTACDEMTLRLTSGEYHKGNWALIISGLEPDEQIADCAGGWMNEWWEGNMV